MLCVPWQTVHSAIPKVSKARLCGLRTKRSRVALWHCAQTLATEATPGGAAPWLPWQSLQPGAWRLPRCSSPWPWTLSRYSAYCVVGMPYGFIRAVSLWQRPHVAGTLVEKTGEVPSLTGRTGCTPWQLIQTATRSRIVRVRAGARGVAAVASGAAQLGAGVGIVRNPLRRNCQPAAQTVVAVRATVPHECRRGLDTPTRGQCSGAGREGEYSGRGEEEDEQGGARSDHVTGP